MRKCFIIEVVSYATGEVEKTFSYTSKTNADIAESGLNRNLDHERFYTRHREGKNREGKAR